MFLFFFKQKTAYDRRISDWSADVCSSDLLPARLDALGPIAARDLSDIERIDTVGAWIVTRTARAHDAKVIGASEDAQRLLNALADDRSDHRVHRERRTMWARMLEEQIGRETCRERVCQ